MQPQCNNLFVPLVQKIRQGIAMKFSADIARRKLEQKRSEQREEQKRLEKEKKCKEAAVHAQQELLEEERRLREAELRAEKKRLQEEGRRRQEKRRAQLQRTKNIQLWHQRHAEKQRLEIAKELLEQKLEEQKIIEE